LRKEFNRAIQFFLESNTLSKQIKSKDIALDNHYFLSKCFINTGKNSLAIENLNKYISLKDSIFFRNQHNLTDLQVTYNTEKVKKEKELLQKDYAILQLEADKQKLLKSRFLMGFALVTLLSLIVLYRYRHKQRLNCILQLRIEEALRQQREQQAIISHQAGLTTLGELAAGVAHEVNQPLQNITLCAESIEMSNKANPIPDAAIKAGVQEISGYIDRVRSIMEHIRLFSSGQNLEYFQKFNINEYIENALRMINQQLQQHGILLKRELMYKLPAVIGNPYQYERVVMNLILNARDAVEEKGKQVNGGYYKEIIVKSWYEENQVILEVTDNGIGIPENQQSKIFQAFYSTKKLGEGQGLGLSIANRTIQRMGGRIEVKSEVLAGTTMRVVVPRSSDNYSSLEYMNVDQVQRDNSHARE
jgi:signal transduction histidine kinase